MTIERTRATVLLLAAQAVWFGVTAALLVIPANGIFLAAYGAEWLPLTYIGIALFGTATSIVIARSMRRWTLPAVSVAVLAATAAMLLGTWAVIAVTGSAWPSVILLIMFPVWLQVGFVIIGAQAGRLLDLQQIKRYFPPIVAGFVVGFMVGGFAAVPLLDLFALPERLVVMSAASCIVFMGLVHVTARRRPAELTVVDRPAETRARPPLRALLTTRFVVVIFVYQILSAMGSQVLDFLVFDRAAARYDDAEELTRFVALLTGLVNAVDLAFVALLAAWLLLRFGLRLGLVANPAVVTALTIAMLIAVLGPGPSSLALFSIVVTTRIIDIALSDGMTRGSINAVFQVLPVEERMAVQASVEGIGVPVAIGATGVLLLVMNALHLGTSAIVAFALVLCAMWTVAAVVGYGDFRGALAARLRRRGLDVQSALPVGVEEQTAVRRLLLTDDVSDIRLGLDLAVTANLAAADLADLARHGDRDIRLLALGQLARRGDDAAATEAITIARQLAGSSDVVERRAAALALTDVRPPDREALLRGLLTDRDVTVRVAALGSVGAGDGEVGDVVLAALEEPATVEVAVDAARRLGAVALELAAERLGEPGTVPPRLLRLVASVDVPAAEATTALLPLVTHPNRRVSVAALTALARQGAVVEGTVLDALLVDDAALCAHALAAVTSLAPEDGAVRRALDDLVFLLADHALAVLAVRHGEERIGAARRALLSTDGQRRALGVEMLLLSITRAEVALVEPVVRDDLDTTDRLRLLRARTDVPDRDRSGWLADLAIDPAKRWRSPWLQAVALHAELASEPAIAAVHARDIGRARSSPPDVAQAALEELVVVASGSTAGG